MAAWEQLQLSCIVQAVLLTSLLLLSFSLISTAETWGGDRCVPIAPVTRTWRSGQRELSRQQLPLRLAWAVTVHKSQGLTLDEAVIDIGEDISTGLSFVAFSRVRKQQDCLIKHLLLTG